MEKWEKEFDKEFNGFFNECQPMEDRVKQFISQTIKEAKIDAYLAGSERGFKFRDSLVKEEIKNARKEAVEEYKKELTKEIEKIKAEEIEGTLEDLVKASDIISLINH